MKFFKSLRSGLSRLNLALTSQYSRNQQLRVAAEQGRVDKVNHWLSHGAKIATDPKSWDSGRTIIGIVLSARKFSPGHVETLKILLEKGADPDDAGKYSAGTPLQIAIRNGWTEVFDILLSAKAKLDVRGQDGLLPLSTAAQCDRNAMAKKLLEAGAAVNAIDSNGWSALSYAVYRGNKTLTQDLLNAGAKADVIDREGRGITDIARAYRRWDLVGVIEQHLDAAVPQWQQAGPRSVAQVSVMRKLGYRLTEVFNFETQQYTAITHNYATGNDVTLVRGFGEMTDKEAIKTAEKHLPAQAASPSPPAVS